MIRFVLNRLLLIAAVAVGIVFFVYLGMGAARLSDRVRPSYNLSRLSTIAWRETELYFAGAWRGDFGAIVSRRTSTPVRDILADTYGKSMGLMVVALGVAALAGLIAGLIAALSRRPRIVFPLLTLTLLGISTPTFFAALLLQLANIQALQLFQVRLAYTAGFGWDKHMVLPVLVLAARPVAYLTRAVYMSLARVMGEEYVRTARAKGLSLRQVVDWHAMRNIAVPTLTALGVSLRFSLGSLPIVEYFFDWPGLGARLLEAIQVGETQLVATLALALGLTFMFVNLALDVLYRLIDPRLREVEAG